MKRWFYEEFKICRSHIHFTFNQRSSLDAVVFDAIELNAMDSTVAKYLTRKEKFELTDSETLIEESDNGDTVSH